MKRFFTTLILIVLVTITVYGQTTTPQLAFRFLDDFIMNKAIQAKEDQKIGAGITMGFGITLMAVGGGLYFWGNDFFALFPDEDTSFWTTETRDITCFSLGLAGLVSMGTGMSILLSDIEDYRLKFSYIYNEEDSVVQEALAAAALYDLAETAKSERITSGMIELATPLLSLIINITINLIDYKPWYEDTSTTLTSLSWNLISGFSRVFIEKSTEERLYEKYRHSKEALLVSNKSNVTYNN